MLFDYLIGIHRYNFWLVIEVTCRKNPQVICMHTRGVQYKQETAKCIRKGKSEAGEWSTDDLVIPEQIVKLGKKELPIQEKLSRTNCIPDK